jgi:hypothetical protein
MKKLYLAVLCGVMLTGCGVAFKQNAAEFIKTQPASVWGKIHMVDILDLRNIIFISILERCMQLSQKAKLGCICECFLKPSYLIKAPLWGFFSAVPSSSQTTSPH